MVIRIIIDMTTLYIIGDSFTVPPEVVMGTGEDDKLYAMPSASWSGGQLKNKADTWINQVAAELSTRHDHLDVVNYSQYGVAQDFCWTNISNVMDVITDQDYLIIAVTHPNRFWYFDKHPNLSNAYSIKNMQQYLGKDEITAVQMFMQFIQRPELDTLHQILRMKSLAYDIVKKKLRRPLMLNCFFTDISAVENLEELMWAQGNLFNIQAQEYHDGEEDSTSYFNGIDCRFNHMCLSNHTIMAQKVVAAFDSNQGPDLDQGFVTGLLKKDSLTDENFCKQELDHNKLRLMRKQTTEKSKWQVLK